MTYERRLKTLLISTALVMPSLYATTAAAQQQDACAMLEQQVAEVDLTGTAYTEEEFMRVVQTGDPQECNLWLEELQAVQAQATDPATQTDEATATAEAEAQVQETQRAIVRMEDEVVLEGQVYVDQQPAQVQVEESPVEVMIGRAQPDVTVTEQPAEIVIRQAAPTIRLDMPQPTISIEQPAPEIIITMPPPGVDVASARPTVEVRQAEPRISVTQPEPMVELELYQAEDAEASPGVQVARRDADAPPPEPQVTMSRSDAQVIYEDDTAPQEASVSLARAQPSVRFEQEDAQVEVTPAGEPQVTWSQVGEAQVVFQEAADQQQGAEDQQMDQAQMQDEQQQVDDQQQLEAQDQQQVMEDEQVATQPQAEGVQQQPGAAPMVEREGYQMTQAGEVQVEELTGATVYGVNDEAIGDVGDVILGQDQQAQEAIVDVGGFLGIGERNVRVPFEELTILRAADGSDLRVYMDTTQEQLETYPEVDG